MELEACLNSRGKNMQIILKRSNHRNKTEKHYKIAVFINKYVGKRALI